MAPTVSRSNQKSPTKPKGERVKNATPATDSRRTSIKKPYDHLRGVCLQKLDDLVTEWSAEALVLHAAEAML